MTVRHIGEELTSAALDVASIERRELARRLCDLADDGERHENRHHCICDFCACGYHKTAVDLMRDAAKMLRG